MLGMYMCLDTLTFATLNYQYTHMQFIYSLWFRIAVPLLALIAVYGYSFVFVSESSLTSCSGRLAFSYGNSYRSDANGSQWFRFIFSQNNFGFGIKDCSVKTFGLQSITIASPSYNLLSELKNGEEITVWFRKRNLKESDCIPIRIAVDGKEVFNKWSHIHLWSLFTYLLGAAVLLWLLSMFSFITGKDKAAVSKVKLSALLDRKANFSDGSPTFSTKVSNNKPIEISDKIWATTEGKNRGLIYCITKQPNAMVATWFSDTKQQTEAWLQQNIGAAPFKVYLISELKVSETADLPMIVLERYPISKKEQQAFEALAVNTVVVLSSLEDAFFKVSGGDSIKSIMKMIGAEQDEVLEHSMITSSIEGIQKKIESKMISDVAANAAADWFNQNKIYSIK